MLGIHLRPGAVLTHQGRDGVAKVGHGKLTIEEHSEEAGRSIRAAVLAGNLHKLIVELLEHYKEERAHIVRHYIRMEIGTVTRQGRQVGTRQL